MANKYWLVKQEPETYSWDAFVKDGKTAWTGVRNFQARNNLREMQTGDWVFYYHSGEERAVVGLARVKKTAYPDPTADEGDWSAVDLEAVKPLTAPVSLQTIKADSVLSKLTMVRASRLSVSGVGPDQFDRLLELSKTKKP